MKDEVEALVSKSRKVSHIAFLATQHQALALRNHPVLTELPWRIVQNGNVGPCGGKDRALLTPG